MTSRLLKYSYRLLVAALLICSLPACKKRVQQQEDELYSRHLQRKVKLTVISTKLPDDKSALHLLLCNDGQLFGEMDMANITDSLFRNKRIEPLVVVGVHAANRLEEFGIADRTANAEAGKKADHYDDFFNNELYPFIKKKAGVRKFKSVVMAGFGAGGLSALDIAWNHPDKISAVGVFSGAFSRKEINSPDSTHRGMMFEKLKSSRKRPHLRYWFFAGANGKTGLTNDDATQIMAATDSIVVLLANKKFIAEEAITFHRGATNDTKSRKQVMPEFIEWAFGK